MLNLIRWSQCKREAEQQMARGLLPPSLSALSLPQFASFSHNSTTLVLAILNHSGCSYTVYFPSPTHPTAGQKSINMLKTNGLDAFVIISAMQFCVFLMHNRDEKTFSVLNSKVKHIWPNVNKRINTKKVQWCMKQDQHPVWTILSWQ